ncbi:FAD-dependent monooxygenase, partial [Nocardioides sp.]|uniref:FAD-dependent monooxygenase n=1 Tax=Nocardioides sp. TaxID=35761 RepID=UPI0035643DDB
FHSRTIEILDMRGIADRFLAEGQTYQGAAAGSPMLDVSDFPTRHPYTLGLWQNHIERILAAWIEELVVPVRRGSEVTGFEQTDDGVTVHLAEGDALRATYLVGADGGRSLIRKLAGIDFPGWEATRSALIAEVEMTEETPVGITHDVSGIHAISAMEDGRTMRVVTHEPEIGPATEPTLADLSRNLIGVFGTDFGAHSPTWISRFTDATRQAATYRSGRVLLAGDAAHIHFPAGGQGIGLGIQDAVNLGWKLGEVVAGVAPDSLLDTYHSERHPATARVLRQTMAMGALQLPGDNIAALRELTDALVAFDEPRRYVAGLLSGLDVHYDLGGGHPLHGRRMPDLDLITSSGPTRVYELLNEARWVLLNFGEPGAVDLVEFGDRVRVVEASYGGEWELPVLSVVPAPTAVLVRPDGYVAWVGENPVVGNVVRRGRV